MLTEVVEGEGSSFRAGTVAIPSSSASLSGKFTKRKTLCHNVVTHRMNRDYVELLGLVPLENLHIESVPIGRAAREAETFVPNLDWSFDAPTMAKFGEDRNSFLICIVAI